MTQYKEPLAAHLTEASKAVDEISITGKWVPSKKGGLFKKSAESKEMLKEWEDIHIEAKNHDGMLSTEINHAVGQDAVLVHHVFQNPDALQRYFSNTASRHAEALNLVARPEIHLVRGASIPEKVQKSIRSKNVPVTFG